MKIVLKHITLLLITLLRKPLHERGAHYSKSSISNKPAKKTLNPLSANPTRWSNTLKQFVSILSTNCLSVFDHFVGLALKGLSS